MRRTRILLLFIATISVATRIVVSGQNADIQTDGFSFREGRGPVTSVPIQSNNGMFEIPWPEGASQWDTAIIGLPISADAGSKSPYVEISSGSLVARQYFSAGDSGFRWLNVSFLSASLNAGSRVMLNTNGVSLSGNQATLRLFSAKPDLTKTILILAPHPDDAEIAAFGVYAHRHSTVVTVTSGNAGDPTYESVFDDRPELYRFKGHLRVMDSITVPWHGGIPPERAFNMGYFDARLGEMYDNPDRVVPEMYSGNSDIGVYLKDNIGSLLPKRPRESKWTNLVDDIEAVLKKVKPAVIVAPHPQLDSHRDHQFTAVALAQALDRWKRPVDLLLYTNHAGENRYPYGPAGSVMSLPPPPARPVQLDRVYSHPVPPPLQREKLFALESMHDLRYNPSRQYQLAVDDERATSPEKPGPAPDITYLRRGPRANELFYVYDRDSLKQMIERFLADRRR